MRDGIKSEFRPDVSALCNEPGPIAGSGSRSWRESLNGLIRAPIRALMIGLLFNGWVTVLPSAANAGRTPAARVCQIAEGQNWFVASHPERTTLDLHLCLFGEAAVEGVTFLLNQTREARPQAIRAFFLNIGHCSLERRRSCESPTAKCEFLGGSVVESRDTQGKTWSICSFPDGSAMEAGTLHRGPQAPENALFVSKLK